MTKSDRPHSGAPGTGYVKRPWLAWVAALGLLLVMTATAMPLLNVGLDIYRIVYSVGAAAVLLSRLFMPYCGNNLRLKRLMRIEAWAGVFFCAGAVIMWLPLSYGIGRTDWIAFTLAGGAICIYTTIMIPRASRS